MVISFPFRNDSTKKKLRWALPNEWKQILFLYEDDDGLVDGQRVIAAKLYSEKDLCEEEHPRNDEDALHPRLITPSPKKNEFLAFWKESDVVISWFKSLNFRVKRAESIDKPYSFNPEHQLLVNDWFPEDQPPKIFPAQGYHPKTPCPTPLLTPESVKKRYVHPERAEEIRRFLDGPIGLWGFIDLDVDAPVLDFRPREEAAKVYNGPRVFFPKPDRGPTRVIVPASESKEFDYYRFCTYRTSLLETIRRKPKRPAKTPDPCDYSDILKSCLPFKPVIWKVERIKKSQRITLQSGSPEPSSPIERRTNDLLNRDHKCKIPIIPKVRYVEPLEEVN